MRAKKTLPLVMGALLLATPALATSKHAASCDKIRAAVDAGKSHKEVAKQMKTSVDHVKHCTSQAGMTDK